MVWWNIMCITHTLSDISCTTCLQSVIFHNIIFINKIFQLPLKKLEYLDTSKYLEFTDTRYAKTTLNIKHWAQHVIWKANFESESRKWK